MRTDAQHRVRMLWLAGVLHGFTHVYHVALMPLYLLIQRDFGFQSVARATSLVTIMMIAYVLPSYFLGILADRINRKKLLGWGLAVNAAGFAGLAFAPNYGWAIVAIVIAAIGGSCYHPAATAMIARLYPVNTGRALGLAGIGAGAGFFFGPIYSGWRATMLEPALGAAAWRRPVLELGLLGIAAAIVFAWLADHERPAPKESIKHNPARGLFPTATLWLLFIACCFAFSLRDFAGAGSGSLGSLFLQYAHGFDAKKAGMALSGLFLASMVSNPLFGSLSDRGRSRWLAFVLIMGAILLLAFPRVPTPWTIPCLVAFGFFFLSSFPMVEAAVMQSVPDAVRGRVFGLFITVAGLIGNLSHWIIGWQVKRMGDAAHSIDTYYPLYGALAALTVLALTGLPFLHAIRRREPAVNSPPRPKPACP